jgi:TusA-related sulfurtransferase
LFFLLELFVLIVYIFPMKTQKRVRKVESAKAAPLPSPDVKTEAVPNVPVTPLECPPPEVLLREAMAEPDRRLIEEYDETIRVLRDDKQFTFREIAEWLNQHGVECDHNSVYREYTKGMTENESRQEEAKDAYADEKTI